MRSMTDPSTETRSGRRERPTLLLTPAVLEEARTFFESCGTRGCEGTALIGGKDDDDLALLGDVLVIPDQIPTPTPRASVTVTPAGDLQLVTALAPDQRYLARIHSHPGPAFHSPTDDANPALTHEGAISIVAPFFGLGLRHGLDACAVYVRHGPVWRELPADGQERKEWVRVHA
jgi:hypothetical protein